MSTRQEWASSCSLFHPPPTFPRGRSCSHQRKPRTFSSAIRTGGSTNKEQKLVFFQLLSSMAEREKGQEEPKPRNHFPLWGPWWFHFNKEKTHLWGFSLPFFTEWNQRGLPFHSQEKANYFLSVNYFLGCSAKATRLMTKSRCFPIHLSWIK